MSMHAIKLEVDPRRLQRLRAQLPEEYRNASDDDLVLAFTRAAIFTGGESLMPVAIGCLEGGIEMKEAGK